MKTKSLRIPKDRVSNQSILKWLAKVVAESARKGYAIGEVTHGLAEQESKYIITVTIHGNPFQRAWRKLTQW